MDETERSSGETVQLRLGIERLSAGDVSVRGELLNLASDQLRHITLRLKREFDQVDQAGLIDRSLDDLLAAISTRLYEALHDGAVRDERHFFQIASREIRRELIDLCEQIEADPSGEFAELAELAQFHRDVDSLPSQEREVFELIHYHRQSHDEVAEMLQIGLSEVKRLWRAARLELYDRWENSDRSDGEKGIDGGNAADSAGN